MVDWIGLDRSYVVQRMWNAAIYTCVKRTVEQNEKRVDGAKGARGGNEAEEARADHLEGCGEQRGDEQE